MIKLEQIRAILELWESGIPKERIPEKLGISLYQVRNCIKEYVSLAEFDKSHTSAAASNPSVRTYVIKSYQRGRTAYSDEDLIKAVPECTSFAKLLERFGLRPAGGNYKLIQTRVKALGLDTSHFKGSHDWAKGRKSTFVRKRDLAEILAKDSIYTSSMLRKRLISEGIFEHRCVSCGLDTWLENKIPPEIDHINGDRRDNRIENLRLLCPNCHALTETYRGKNKRVSLTTSK